MDGSLGGGKAFFKVSFVLILFFVIPFSHASLWTELLHPKLTVSITSKIPGVVHVKCISSKGDIKERDLDGSKTKSLTFDVELKLLTTIRYNCILKQKGYEIGQFLGFRSGSYCEKGCDWNLYPRYAQRRSSFSDDFVNQTYKPIGSPDDNSYDFS